VFCGSWLIATDAVTVTAGLLTVNDAVDELLLVLLSGGEPAPEAIVAVLLMVAPSATLQLTATTTVNVPVSPLVMPALVQVIVPVPPAGMVLQVHPPGFVCETTVTPAGNVSLTVTLLAGAGPLLINPIV
jgi:hypothetical protein